MPATTSTHAAPVALGLDLGTSSAKLLALDATGVVVAATGGTPYRTAAPAPGWAEQDPGAWWRAARAECRALLADERMAGRTVAAIGLTGQMHGATLLDAANRPLRPALIWADARGAAELAELAARLAPGDLLATTGSAPYASATLAKLLWLRAHEPALFARAAHVLLAKDYVRLRLTGAHATDPSDAAGTQLYDIARGAWAPEVLASARIDPALLPPVLPSDGMAGTLTAWAARATGLPRGVPVVVGGGDAMCAAYGMGLGERAAAAGARELLISIGTAGQVAVVADRPLIAAGGAVQTLNYVLPDRWLVMGAILAAGHALAWLARAVASPRTGRVTHMRLNGLLNEAAQIAPGADGLLFLPTLRGERGSEEGISARGAFVGLRAGHTRAHLARAVVEGVAFALRARLEAMRAAGIAVERALVAGGSSRHPLWQQVLADALDLPTDIGESEHGSALGAARLAARATFGDPFQGTPPPTLLSYDPDPATMRLYDDLYALSQQMTTALRPTFRALGALPGASPRA